MSSLYAKMLSNPHPDLLHPFEDEDDDWEREAAKDLEADTRLAAAEFRDRIREIWVRHDCSRLAHNPDWAALEELIRDDLDSNVFYEFLAELGRE